MGWSRSPPHAACRAGGIPCAFLPGDDQPDIELQGYSALDAEAYHRLWQYLLHGGPDNARSFLAFAASLLPEAATGDLPRWMEPKPLLRAGLYWPGVSEPDLAAVRAHWQEDRPVAAIVFYRALVQASNLAPLDSLVRALWKYCCARAGWSWS
jgi:cobaltochelatase CobN